MIELILTLVMSFGTGWMHFKPQPRRPPPRECRVVAYTNTIPPHVIYDPPGCTPSRTR